MAIEFESVAFVTADPGLDAAFWGAMLDRTPVHDADGILLPGCGGQLGLRFAAGDAAPAGHPRLHLHLSQTAARGQLATISAAEAHGARLRGNGNFPAGDYAAMSDPMGDDFCVIEDGNRYLDGCGPLGEVTIDGSKAVGRFWSAALGWPLVWERGDETAIQSPQGGTKVAWGGEATPSGPTDRHWFVFRAPAARLEVETRRLIDLGAVRGEDGSLADPDGIRFELRAAA